MRKRKYYFLPRNWHFLRIELRLKGAHGGGEGSDRHGDELWCECMNSVGYCELPMELQTEAPCLGSRFLFRSHRTTARAQQQPNLKSRLLACEIEDRVSTKQDLSIRKLVYSTRSKSSTVQ
jgi:hypothetical protein